MSTRDNIAERATLDTWYTELGPGALRHAMKLVKDEAEAWDVVHEIFSKLCAQPILAARTPAAYLHQAVTRTCLNHLRAHRRHQDAGRVDPAEEPPELLTDALEGATEAREILARLALDALDAHILVLHLADGHTQAEVAATLHVSRRTLTRHLLRIEADLRRCAGAPPRLVPGAPPG